MTVIRSGADVDRLQLQNPDEYENMLKGWRTLTRNPSTQPSDLRVSSIKAFSHLDTRRYGFGLPRITAGMSPLRAGELVAAGAREGHGKTAFGELLALENSLEHKVLFVTMELTREEILDRLLAKLMRTSVKGVQHSRKVDTQEYCQSYGDLIARQLLVYRPESKPERTVEALTQMAVDVSAELLIIDHAREITGWKPGEGSSVIMDSLGWFVRKARISTVLLSQLNRDAAVRRPHNGHFQDTGKIEQKADRAILLYRPYLGQGSLDRVCEVIVSKNRCGPCFRGHAHWDGPTLAFHDMTPEEESNQDCCKGKRAK